MQDCRYIFSASHPTVALVDTSILFILYFANADVPSTVLLWVDLLLTVPACKTIWDDVGWDMADEKGIPPSHPYLFLCLGQQNMGKRPRDCWWDGVGNGVGVWVWVWNWVGVVRFGSFYFLYRAPMLLHELLWSMQSIYFSDETELLPVDNRYWEVASRDYWQESFENLRSSNLLSRKTFLFQAIHSVP